MITVRSIAIGDRVWYTDSNHVFTHNGPTPGCKSGLGTVQAIDDWGGVAVVKMDNGEKIGAMFPEVQSLLSGRMTFRTKTDRSSSRIPSQPGWTTRASAPCTHTWPPRNVPTSWPSTMTKPCAPPTN